MVADGKIPPADAAADLGSGRIAPGTAEGESSLNDVGRNLGAAYAYGLSYVSAQAARFRLAARKLLMLGVLAIVAGIFAAGALLTATVLLLRGISGAISTGLRAPPWEGDLITGAIIVGGTAVAAALVISRISRAAKLRTMPSYHMQQKSVGGGPHAGTE